MHLFLPFTAVFIPYNHKDLKTENSDVTIRMKGGQYMKCEIIINPDCEEKIIIHAKEHRQLIDEIKQLAESESVDIVGFSNKESKLLNSSEIFCITVIDNKIFALTDSEKFQLRDRLYVIEAKLPENFIRINQSCIANVDAIDRFDASVSGTLKIRFRNGYVDYVSRRQVKAVKERIGI